MKKEKSEKVRMFANIVETVRELFPNLPRVEIRDDLEEGETGAIQTRIDISRQFIENEDEAGMFLILIHESSHYLLWDNKDHDELFDIMSSSLSKAIKVKLQKKAAEKATGERL